jgi:ABC-type glycerol-3-phosphate transport system substrate-binding protein
MSNQSNIEHQASPVRLAGLSRRQFLTWASGVASAAALAACAAPAPGGQTGTAGSAPATEQQQVIFWGHDQHPLDLAAEGFVQEYPDIEWISPHPAESADKLKAAFAAGSGCPDLFWAEATDAQDWGCNDLLVDLTSELEGELENYHPLKINETFVAKTGRHVGWPGDISVSGWYYREDKLQEAGLGGIDFNNWTWEDFFEMAEVLKGRGEYSFVFPADGWSALFMFALHQYGGTAVSRDGSTITVAEEPGLQAMQLVKRLWDSGAGLDVAWWSPPYWAALKDGELVGDFAAAWARGFWEAQLAEAGEDDSQGQWRIARFPGGPGIQYHTGIWGGAQLVSPKCGDNPENALLFMRYALGSVDGARRCGEWGIIPAYRPYLESEEFLSMRSPVFGDWAFNEFWASQEQELSTEFYRPAGWGAVNTVINKEMVGIMLDEYSVEEGMARIVDLATPDFDRTRCA